MTLDQAKKMETAHCSKHKRELEVIYYCPDCDNEESNRLDKPVKPDACEHNYQIAKRDYYKPTGQIGALGVMTYNQERTYSTLFCTKCGETKEIITS